MTQVEDFATSLMLDIVRDGGSSNTRQDLD